MNARRLLVLLCGLASLPASTAFATTAVLITARTLATYDLESAYLAPNSALATQALPGCPNGWTYLNGGYFGLAGNTYYQVLRTTLTATATVDGSSTSFGFGPTCDGTTYQTMLYDQNLLSLSEVFADMKAGVSQNQTCQKSVSCAGPAGTAPCETFYGTQTGTDQVVVQLDNTGHVIDWQTSVAWSPCE